MFVTEVPGVHVRVRYMKYLTIEPKMTLISSAKYCLKSRSLTETLQ